jgi:hypothetical protein
MSTPAAALTGVLTVQPNPVAVCEKTGFGPVTVKWKATGTEYTEIRVAAPDGTLVATGRAEGSVALPPWVGKGTVFLLQDGTAGAPHDTAHTLARLEVDKVVAVPCAEGEQ